MFTQFRLFERGTIPRAYATRIVPALGHSWGQPGQNGSFVLPNRAERHDDSDYLILGLRRRPPSPGVFALRSEIVRSARELVSTQRRKAARTEEPCLSDLNMSRDLSRKNSSQNETGRTENTAELSAPFPLLSLLPPVQGRCPCLFASWRLCVFALRSEIVRPARELVSTQRRQGANAENVNWRRGRLRCTPASIVNRHS